MKTDSVALFGFQRLRSLAEQLFFDTKTMIDVEKKGIEVE
jgi:hypothetical protein